MVTLAMSNDFDDPNPTRTTQTKSGRNTRVLRLGTYGVEQQIVRHIGVLLRFLDHQNQYQWQLVESGHMDLIITTERAQDQIPPVVASAATSIVTMVDSMDPEATSPNQLPRHFRSKHLERVLKPVESGASDRTETPAATPEARPNNTPKKSTDRFRLLRWPPAALVRRDPTRTRLASMLTRTPVSLDELARRSGQTPQICMDFVKALKSVGLIETSVEAPKDIEAPNQAPRSLTQGLIRSLRRHLRLDR